MARRMIEVVVDDLSGETLEEGKAETIRFSIGATAYQMDLGEASAKQFHDAMAPYVAAAVKVGKAPASGAAAVTPPGRRRKDELLAIRRWAAENGHELSNRGRIPDAVVQAYRAAH